MPLPGFLEQEDGQISGVALEEIDTLQTDLEPKQPSHLDHNAAVAELSEAVGQERVDVAVVRVDDEQLAAGAVLPAQAEVAAQ